QDRHRLSRSGNRRINRVLHIMAIVQLRHDTEGRRYFDRRVAEGKTTMEAMRALKRRLSDQVYKRMIADARPPERNQQATGLGGRPGATLESSAASPIPTAGASDQSQPRPATQNRRTRIPANH
ncbi:MAG: IS110 family transposase, partial [Dactylosporangium sp.]|nr:IS110 family transposase [Dactylosporangium sp.]NNJ63617.1 IS110 family transposase [Dactylosporangium sp.]